MNSEVLRWLMAQLGPDSDPADLGQRYERLRSARAVAQEVLQERIASLLAEPLRVSINGIATIDQTSNVAALERRLTHVADQTAPDDAEKVAFVSLASIPLVARPRR
ncbi:hypothetical protein ACIRUY_29715 [Streptomyces erythrochromogenes]|uniref:hypothetical protein n=1 Tax=Streptomyces erythrochromogenes TaxID=285574 RepID=UPI0034460D2F